MSSTNTAGGPTSYVILACMAKGKHIGNKKRSHIWTSGATLVAVAVISSLSLFTSQGIGSLRDHPASIAIEHSMPLDLSFDISVRSGQALIELRHKGRESISLSVPSDWERREVWNAPLRDITADPSSFGFTRWHLPPDTGISFLAPAAPTTLVLHNPTEELLTIDLTHINLDTAELTKDVVLVQGPRQVLW